MRKVMTTPQIVEMIAGRTGVPKKNVKAVLDHFSGLARSEARNGFRVPGIGKLVIVDRPARICRNPSTGEPIAVPARKPVKFMVSKVCKEVVLGGMPF